MSRNRHTTTHRANRDPNAESEDETDSDSSEEETPKKTGGGDDDEDSSSEEESSSDDENRKKKGVSGLIEIENPNHRKKTTTKVTKVDLSAAGTSSKPELSRREREELDKQRAAANYAKMHAEGKTEQARADLARLAIIKQHRAEAAARREAEKKEKDDKTAKKTAAK